MIRLIGEKLKRYDLNRTVEIAPRRGNTLHEVRFYKDETFDIMAVSTREENGAIIADIPNLFLQNLGTLVCRIASIDKHGHLDFEDRSFVIHNREKPDDYEYVDNIKANDVLEGGGSGGSGGEKTFIFTQRNASDGQITYSANMTYEDLKAALKSENPPLCIARMITFGETSGGETVPCAYFSMITEISLNLSLNSIKLTVNNGAEYAFNSDGSIYLMG